MKLFRSVLPLALVLPLVACGSDSTGPEGSALVGTWNVTSAEGMDLPFQETVDLGGGFSCTFAVASMEITFRSNGSFEGQDTSSVQCTGEPVEDTSETFTGTWSVDGDRVTITADEDGETVTRVHRFTISGGTLTIYEGLSGSATAVVAVRM